MPSTLSPVNAAYLAGFFDGEGSLIQVKEHAWRVVIYQGQEDVIRWIQDVTGTGSVYERENPGTNLIKKRRFKTGWVWQLHGYSASLFIRQLLPFMRVKNEQAYRMIGDYPLVTTGQV